MALSLMAAGTWGARVPLAAPAIEAEAGVEMVSRNLIMRTAALAANAAEIRARVESPSP